MSSPASNLPEPHPVFRRFKFALNEQPKGWYVDGMGIRTDPSFMDMSKWKIKFFVPAAEPPFDDNYLEWIDVLCAVDEARGKFVMVELGAGYGPWLIAAAVALRQIEGPPCLLIAVEAEPTRYAWITQHFRDNGIDPGPHKFVRAAIVPEGSPEKAWFQVGDPRSTYGASLRPAATVPTIITHRWQGVWATAQRLVKRLLGEPRPQKVVTISLSALLSGVDHVDLLDLDIQGAELAVLESAIDILNTKVRRIHIGTHSRDIESGLRILFEKHGWDKVFDYPTNSLSDTPYGKFEFHDGVQSWVNPRLK